MPARHRADSACMTKRLAALLPLAAICVCVLALGPATTGSATAPDYRPDGWIKLCGLSNGCKVGPKPPHPWHGNNVYNTTAAKQTIKVRMEDGEGARFWLTFQNDGAKADTLRVQGCKGTRRFVVNKVQLGKHKNPSWKSTKVTTPFKKGTLKFALGPGESSVITLNIIAPTTKEGITYRCPVTVSSTSDPSLKDTVAAQMTTY
jgi:hypothetical protein